MVHEVEVGDGVSEGVAVSVSVGVGGWGVLLMVGDREGVRVGGRNGVKV